MPDFDFAGLEKDLKDSFDGITETDVMSAALYPQVKKEEVQYGRKWKNKAGYTAQDVPSMRTFHL